MSFLDEYFPAVKRQLHLNRLRKLRRLYHNELKEYKKRYNEQRNL